ncbi:hypothetical protein KGY71_06225 [Candidatus Bipolaricaulota bacterium]|nr:hypothetical protein [Candidatus Bipolaricaulota bacterium]
MWIFLIIPALATAFSWIIALELLPRMKEEGIKGKDIHKAENPHVPEMGGLVLVGGFTLGMLAIVGFSEFAGRLQILDLRSILAAGFTVLILALIGMVDDLLGVRQLVKAFLPMLAALPLMAIKAGKQVIGFPIRMDIGLVYPLLVVPIGVTGAANAMNMLAGFNGLEVGLGVVMTAAFAFIGWYLEAWTAFFILISLLGPLLVTLYYNWYPAKLFVGDVGTLSIGAVIATAVIIGNYEWAGVIVIIPFVIDFFLKAASGFPSSGWGGELGDEGELVCPQDRPVSLPQLVMKVTGGITERNLVLVLLGVEAVFAALAVVFYL